MIALFVAVRRITADYSYADNVLHIVPRSYVPFATRKPIVRHKTIRLLILASGGDGGILSLDVLKYIDKKTGKPISQLYDFISGVSVGSIIGSMISMPDENGRTKYSAVDIEDEFARDLPKIFSAPWWQKLITLDGWFGPKYSNKYKEKYLRNTFGPIRMNKLLTNLMVLGYSFGESRTRNFHSWESLSNDFYLWELVQGCASPITFFSPVVAPSIDGKKALMLTDGALASSLNLLGAINDVKTYYPDTPLVVTVIGAGMFNIKYNLDKVAYWGKGQWIPEIVPFLSKLSEDYTLNEQRFLIKYNSQLAIKMMVFNPVVKNFQNIHFEYSADLFRIYHDVAQQMITDRKAQLDELVAFLDSDW